MPHASFSHVNTWVFDLDNTLYPPSARLFDQIEQRMTHWVMTIVPRDVLPVHLCPPALVFLPTAVRRGASCPDNTGRGCVLRAFRIFPLRGNPQYICRDDRGFGSAASPPYTLGNHPAILLYTRLFRCL